MPVNKAEQVWLAQEDVWRTGDYLRQTYGTNALGWLRAARLAAGSPITTGVYVERANGAPTYTAGGSSLRITAANGRHFELRFGGLVGNIDAPGFPNAGESVDVSWVWAWGGSARCAYGPRSALFLGAFATAAGENITVNITETTNSDVYGGNPTEVFGDGAFSGFVSFEAQSRRVDFETHVAYSTCAGSCGFTAAADYVYSHTTMVTLAGVAWHLAMSTGWTKQSPSSLPAYRWEGTITGPSTGRLEKRPVANAAEALDVVIGADRYTTRGVATP